MVMAMSTTSAGEAQVRAPAVTRVGKRALGIVVLEKNVSVLSLGAEDVEGCLTSCYYKTRS